MVKTDQFIKVFKKSFRGNGGLLKSFLEGNLLKSFHSDLTKKRGEKYGKFGGK